MKETKYSLWLSPWDYSLSLLETMFKENGLDFTSFVSQGDEDTLYLEGIVYYFNSQKDLELAIEVSDNF